MSTYEQRRLARLAVLKKRRHGRRSRRAHERNILAREVTTANSLYKHLEYRREAGGDAASFASAVAAHASVICCRLSGAAASVRAVNSAYQTR